MADIGLTWVSDVNNSAADMSLESNDLAQDGGLETAIILSLFTDRLAEESDELPAGETSRRGWWGDGIPPVAQDRFGSRLWLINREKQTTQVLERAREYAEEALRWLLEDKIAIKYQVETRILSQGILGIGVIIYRPAADPVKYHFEYIWQAQEQRTN